MGHAKNNVSTQWTPSLAYVIGIIASDGNVSPDLRHVVITSKDEDLLIMIRTMLGLKNVIGRKARGGSAEKKYFVLQFGDVNFIRFLRIIGITERKSKTIQRVNVPVPYFADFLRGVIDGDGCIDAFTHPESKHSQIRIRIASASSLFLKWLAQIIAVQCGTVGGWIYSQPKKGADHLTYAKYDSLRILRYIYYKDVKYYLERKYRKTLNLMGE